MNYGAYLKELIDSSDISKTKLCSMLGVSRPYLYAVFSGTTPPPVPEKQRQIVAILKLNNEKESLLYDLAAKERDELPADIVACVADSNVRKEIRKKFVHANRDGAPAVCVGGGKGTLRVPCCYQGGKQRVAHEIVDAIFKDVRVDRCTKFYDLCCGSGAYSIELMNRGISPENICMVDISSWGCFWKAVGDGTFEMDKFRSLLSAIPSDMRLVHDFACGLAEEKIDADECYKFIVLQACSFGGKQIWNDGVNWKNPFFRNYWEPTETSVRRSPANPMQPSPRTLERRVGLLVEHCVGVKCHREDVRSVLEHNIPSNAVVYLDPPYRGTTGYAFGFDVDRFIGDFVSKFDVPLYVSEGVPLNDSALRLAFGGSNGGISGNRAKKHQEWLNKIG